MPATGTARARSHGPSKYHLDPILCASPDTELGLLSPVCVCVRCKGAPSRLSCLREASCHELQPMRDRAEAS
jgi:hypothetical protein